jgi:hypothetical protein
MILKTVTYYTLVKVKLNCIFIVCSFWLNARLCIQLSTVFLVCSGERNVLFNFATICIFIFYQMPRHSIKINIWWTFIKFRFIHYFWLQETHNVTPFHESSCSSNCMDADISGRVIHNTMKIQCKIRGTEISSPQKKECDLRVSIYNPQKNSNFTLYCMYELLIQGASNLYVHH